MEYPPVSSQLHPDSALEPTDECSNPSPNPSFNDVLEQRQLSRRGFLKARSPPRPA